LAKVAKKKQPKEPFRVGNPSKQIEALSEASHKYRLKEKGLNFRDISHLTPTFAFDYLSLSSSDLCFNKKGLCVDDYVGFLFGLKKLSTIPYDTLKRNPTFRFHAIDFSDSRVSLKRKDFKDILTSKEELLNDDEMPTLYQLDIQYVREARICGFLYRGTFYIVWFDRDHIIYKRK